MFDNEVIGARYGIGLAVLGLVLGILGPITLIAAIVSFVRKRRDRAARYLVAAPALLVIGFLMLQSGCVRSTVAVDLSSPQNSFRARTLIRNSGSVGSLIRIVQVATRGIVGWRWRAVMSTSSPGALQIEWRDDATLVIRARLERIPELTQPEGARVLFEPCPAPTGPAPALLTNSCG
jgi:hypothetical protein